RAGDPCGLLGVRSEVSGTDALRSSALGAMVTPSRAGEAGVRSGHRRGRGFLVGPGRHLPHPHRGELAGPSMDQVRAPRDPPFSPVVLRNDAGPAVVGPSFVPRSG